MAKTYRKPVVEALHECGFEIHRTSRHGVVYKHPDDHRRVNVPFKLQDKNRAQRLLRGVGVLAL